MCSIRPLLLFLVQSAEAVPFHDAVGDDDLSCHQIGIFHVIDDLRGCFIAQLEGIDVHGSQLRGR